MKRYRSILMLCMATMLTNACTKDSLEPGTPREGDLILKAEGDDNPSKMVVDGMFVNWRKGDKVKINGSEYSVQIINNVATITSAPSGDLIAFFPTSLSDESSPSATSADVSLPTSYVYSETSTGRQILDMPMVGKASSSDPELVFRHICGTLLVKVSNETHLNMILDSIRIISDNHQISGDISGLSLDNVMNGSFAVDTRVGNTATKTVLMTFGSGRLIESGDVLPVQIPILPVDCQLTVKVYTHDNDRSLPPIGASAKAEHMIYDRTTASSVEVPRMTVVGVPVAINLSSPYLKTAGGLFGFTINGSGDKVYFAQGNLQYNISESKWSFMDHQYSTVEVNYQNISTDYANQNIVGLFGWGTSGYNGKYPNMTNTNNSSYYNSNIAGTNYDWGKYNAISNGGNTADQWRTMTYAEWNYLLNTRTNAANKIGYGTVGGAYGIILLPDDFSDPNTNNGSGPFAPKATTGWNANVYTAGDNWNAMENAGAVFLPAAGFRDNQQTGSSGQVGGVNNSGYYWTGTYSNNSLAFGNNGSWMDIRSYNEYVGRAVRLVHNAN